MNPTHPVPPDTGELAPRQPAELQRIGTRDLTTWRSRAGRWLVAHLLERRDTIGGLARWAATHLVLAVALLFGGALVFGLALGTGEIYESVIAHDGVAALDQPVLDHMVSWRSHGVTRFFGWVSTLGGPVVLPILATVFAVGLAFWWRRWTPVVLMGMGAAVSLAVTVAGKHLTGRARPAVRFAVAPFESSPSFPSGHTLNTTVVVGIAAYLLLIHWRGRWARLSTVCAAALAVGAVGVSRVYLGHHWLTDVMAGWCIGLGWVAMVVLGHRLWLTLRATHAVEPTRTTAPPH
jgi:undecaprenyl-diphosphatase